MEACCPRQAGLGQRESAARTTRARGSDSIGEAATGAPGALGASEALPLARRQGQTGVRTTQWGMTLLGLWVLPV
jgi:hypothetical protein